MFRSRRRNHGQGGSFGFRPFEQEQHSLVPVRRNDAEIDVEYVDLDDDDDGLDEDIDYLTSNPVEEEMLEIDGDLNCDRCGGPLEALGQLGSRCWLRCRNCGVDQDAGLIPPPAASNPRRRNFVDSMPRCVHCGGFLTYVGPYRDHKVCKTCEPDRYRNLFPIKSPSRPNPRRRNVDQDIRSGPEYEYVTVTDPLTGWQRQRISQSFPPTDILPAPLPIDRPTSNPRRYRRNSLGRCPHCGSGDTYNYSMGSWIRSKCGNCGMDPTFSYRPVEEERKPPAQPTQPVPHPQGYSGPHGFAAAIDAAKDTGMRSIVKPSAMHPVWLSLYLPTSELIEALGSHPMRARDLTWYVKGNLLTSDGGDRFELK